jgi:tetratricopeptide (TPR) repeat protein
VQRLIDQHCPPEWRELPALQSALGSTWRDIGDYEKARTAFLRAVQYEDKLGRVPITDVQQLANVESRLGERNRDAAMIELGLGRLRQLDSLVADASGQVPLVPARCALQGAALKRLAFLHACSLLEAARVNGDAVPVSGLAMMEALEAAVEAYQRAEGVAGQAGFLPYLALNRLALDSLTPWDSDAERDAALAIGHQCLTQAGEEFQRDAGFFNAVMQPEAMFVQRLLDRSIGAEGEAGETAWREVTQAYLQAVSNISVKPKDLDSVLSQMLRLSTLLDAVALFTVDDDPVDAAAMRRIAGRLIVLADTLQPGISRDRAARPDVKPAAKQSAAQAQRQARTQAKADAAALADLTINVPPARKGAGARGKAAAKKGRKGAPT